VRRTKKQSGAATIDRTRRESIEVIDDLEATPAVSEAELSAVENFLTDVLDALTSECPDNGLETESSS